MAKQLNVNLAFTADTSKAKAQLQDLQKSLDSLLKGSAQSTEFPITKELMEAQNAAASLKVALDSAINTQTGKLDITKFSSSMKAAGLDATTLRKHLENLGPAGNQAFLTLTKSVMNAELPIKRTNALVAEMWTTLKNTARWQISSSILHGFMGTVSSAYGYAKDLNESLNNIRIVTGQNTDEMARFAEQANKAARALSATTTDYTNASLIYYQQGLSDAEVAARTEVTIKMANAAGQSAEIISDQLTAVWNNFYDGSKSLEYYADVMTALGAATASSTDEISEGLNKFASIAETVGLSYEYAASALATVTATTRQSADVVGTAFKTLFARLQDLELGETLDDGTTLGKYSDALNRVGIDIKDTNGEMKDMDQILDELGNKWNDLSKDTQVALAQTVAGTRQYTQLVALMDNWDYFQENLNVARDSDGTLQEQADIYAESWEAARDRVKAASEDLFDSILDDDFFIDLLNGFEKAIGLAANLVDSLGGLPGVLSVVAALMTKIFSKQLETTIDNMIYGINSLTGTNLKNSKDTKESYAKEAEKVSFNDASDEGTAIGLGMQQQTALQKELLANEASLSEAEKQRIQNLMDIHQLYVDQAAAAGKAADAARQIVQEQNKEARIKVKRSEKEGVSVDTKQFTKARAEMSAIIKTGRNAQKSIETLGKAFGKTKDPQAFAKQLDVVQNRLNSINKDSGSAKEFSNLAQQFKSGKITAEQFSQGLKKLAESGEVVDDAVIAASDAVKNLGDGQVFTTQETDAMANAELKLQNNAAKANGALNAQTQQANNIKIAIAGAKGALDSLATSIVKVMQGVSQIGMAITSFTSILDVLNNSDMSFGEKMLSVTMSLSMAIPALIGGIKALTAAKWADIAASAKDLIVKGAQVAITTLQAIGLGGLIGAKTADTAATLAGAAANMTWQATAWPILLITLLIVAAIGTLVLIVWAVVSAFEAFKASTPEGKLKAAKENAEELNGILEETKKAADDLKAAFDKYDSAVDKLEDCTKGTQEWREALQEVNSEVLDLLSKYPQLATMTNAAGESAISRGKNGEMVVADWARDELVNSANLAVTNAQTAATLANQDVREAQIVVDTADLRKEIFGATSGISATATTSTTANGQTYESSYDAAYIMKDYISKNAAKLSGMTPEEQKAFLQEFIDSRNIDTDINEWTKVVTDLGPKFGELAGAIEANTKAIQIENETIASNALAGNEDVQNSDYVGEITKIVAQGLDQEADKYEQELKDNGWGTDGINKATGVNDEARKIFAEYAAAAGITNYDLLDTTGTDKNRKFVYNNGEEEVTVSLEAMRQVVAAQKANADLVADADKLVETLTRLGPEGAAAATAAVTGDASQLTVGQMSGDYDIEAIANDLSAEELSAMGYASAEEFIAAFNETVATADEAWEDIVDNYSKTVKKSLRGLKSSGELDNLTLGEAEKFGEALQQAFNTSGQEGIDTLTSMLSDAGDYSDEFANAIDGIDWDTATVNDLEIALENAGVECDFTTEELQNLIDVMSDGAIVFAEAAEIYKNLHDIIDELETGDTVSAEDFTTLKETFGSQMTEYFMQMADGSYKLVGDAEEFYNLVNNYTVENFEKTIDNLNQVEEEINNLLSNYSESSIQNKTHDGKRWQFGAKGDQIEGYDKTQAQAQYDFLKNSGYADEDALAEWREGIENNTITIAQLNEMQRAVEENAGSWDQLTEAQQLNNEQMNQAQEALASTATSVGELNDMLATGRIDIEEYNKALDSITEAEIESYGLDPEEYKEVAEAIEDMGAAGEEWYEELKDDQEALNEATKDASVRYMRMNDAIEDLYDNYEDYSGALKDVQKAQTKADKALAANTETAKKLRGSLAGLLGVTEDLIDADLLDAISPDDLEAAANGDAAAIERIRDAWIELQAAEYMGEDAIAGLKSELDSFNDGAMLDLDTMPFLNSLIQAWVDAGLTADQIESRLSGMNIDADVSPFNEAMAEMVTNADAAGSAVVKSTSIKQTAEVVEESTPNTQTGFTETVTPHMRTDWAVMPTALGAPLVYQTRVPYYTKSIAFDTESEDIVTPVVGVTSENGAGESGDGGVIIQNAHKSSGNKVSSGNTGKPPVGDTGGGGGGGSKPSTIERRDTTSQGDVVERYREVNDAIDNVTDALTRAERATSRLWGKAKFDAMREENKILREQYELLQEKARQAEEYAKTDATNLRNVAEEIGVSVVIDPDTGDITNIEDVEKTLHERLAAAENEYNQKVDAYNAAVAAAGESPTEAKLKELEAMKEAIEGYEKDVIGGIEDDIDAWEEAEQQFKDSVETWEEAGLSAEEIMDQIMQNNFDIWSEGLELRIEVNDRELETLDYYLSKVEDDVYSMAEAAAYMVGSLEGLNSGKFGGQLATYVDSLSTYQSSFGELNSLLAEGEITEAAYHEGLESIRSGLLDNLQSLNELDDAMLSYYADTLSMVTEEIDKYTAKMEHQTDILEHYGNMMSILGKEQDYDSMGTILQGQVDVLEDQLDVAKAEYDLYAQEAANKRKLYEDAVAAGDEAAAEVYKKEWEAADEAAMEAQADMLDKTEEWAESMRAVVENKLAGLAQSLEDALTGGTSFDELTTSLERAASLQEEYLTTTNQIYETNKLMRTAQQEIDKTTNTVAKQRLKDFIKETDQLQDKSKLSQYELEIQQAKYDLLLAEIALEEAQSAKSTVRLQRDAEGNFGYVYTADQDQLANAQQELENAQNSLYNIGLEGANEYTEKYSQTMQEMYDTLTSIQEAWLNGEIATQEEYDRQMLAAQEYYYQQLEDYSNLYSIAISTDSRVVKDAWSTGFNSMMSKTNEWKDKVNQYSAEARETLVNWYAKVDEIANKTGLDNIASKVKAVTDESKALKDAVIGEDGKGGVVQALKDELTAVSNLTGGYATLRGTIQGLIADYEVLMKTVNNAQNQQASNNQTTENGDGGSNGDGNTGGNTGGSGNGGNTGGSGGGTGGAGDGGGNVTPTLSEGQDVTVKSTATHFSRDGGNGTRMRSFVPGSTYSVMQVQGEEVLIGRNGVATGWVRKTDLVGFNTGGYTGEWGPYGKLAILDEKELVLNKSDTANFLASMELLEHILEIIDLQTASAQLGGLLSSPGYADTSTETIEQNVHIEASFPAVQDRNEIEEAFNTLINRASQYANRK